jgi:hypothetical protein
MSKGTIGPGLNYLARALKTEKLCPNTKPISDAVNELTTRKDPAGFWGYNLQKLEFQINDVPRDTMPNNVKLLKIILNVEIHEKSCAEKEIINPIVIDKSKATPKAYSFSIEIYGMSDGKKVLSHWHLDFDSSDTNEYLHPDFHLTFGGKAMKEESDDENNAFGKVLILPSPRLSHPPMDAILGIDFILKNFVKKETAARLTNNSEYKNAIKASQNRLWRPYILATANHWCNFNCSKFNGVKTLASKYYPSLLN